MSKFTTEVRFICESYAGLDHSVGYDQINEVIHASHNEVMGSYPIFDENYREALNSKILKHYYTREICEETVGLWKLRLNNRMNEIMPYYNKLYSSELFHFNPYYDVDLTTSRVRNEDSTGNATSTTDDNRVESKITDGDTTRESENETKRQDVRMGSSDSERTSENTDTRQDVRASNSDSNTTSENSNSTHTDVNANSQDIGNKNQTDKYSDTPQGGITGLESGTYLTNARIIGANETNNNITNQESNANGSGTFKEDNNSSSSEQFDTSGKSTIKEGNNSSSSEQFDTSGKSTNKDSTKNSVNELLNANGNAKKVDENNISSTEDYLEHVQGKRGGVSYSKMLMEYRETFLNIDKMIIDELGDLFFGLWE